MNSKSDRRLIASLLPVILMLTPSVCFAHTENDAGGFMAGLLHPVFGPDHLLAMVSVGIVSSQLGGANIWLIPVAFVSAMIVGGAIGIFQVPLPLGEIGIAMSVIFLGLAIFRVSRDTSPWLTFVFVIFFGMFHGHAHGLEMPASASPAFYTFGFLISTSLLHVTGVLIGEISTRRERLYSALRYSGAGMAMIGVTFLLNT